MNTTFCPMKILRMICFLIVVALAGCGPRDESPIIGKVVLSASGESDLQVAISHNPEQPWRLRFDLPQGFDGGSGYSGRVSIFMRNNDSLPLEFDTGRSNGDLKISPAESKRIFSGTFDEMFMLGRTSQQEMTIISSKSRPVNVTFKFVHDLKDRDLEVIVSTWFLHYGM
jgi:hypothetical protein